MGIGTGLFLFAVGAILRYAVSVQVQGFNVHMIGVILMVAGVAATILSMFFWQSWGGFHRAGGPGRVVRQREIP
ncbi:MAG: hypothetical protein NVSMB32_12670 [Actinomycetota bacterium]